MDTNASNQMIPLNLQRPPKKRRVEFGLLSHPRSTHGGHVVLRSVSKQSKGTGDTWPVLNRKWLKRRVSNLSAISLQASRSKEADVVEIDLDALTYYPPQSEQSPPESTAGSNASGTLRTFCQDVRAEETKRRRVRFATDSGP